MKSRGEMEAAVCDGMVHFERECLGRGPSEIRAHLLGDLLIVRMLDVLTPSERHLIRAPPCERGRELLKQVRTQLVEAARPAMQSLVHEVTGVRPVSLHYDISTVTGEEILIFVLPEAPAVRAPARSEVSGRRKPVRRI